MFLARKCITRVANWAGGGGGTSMQEDSHSEEGVFPSLFAYIRVLDAQ